jgi:hypothetical protein
METGCEIAYSPSSGTTLRGGPMRAGWNKTAADIVQSRANASSLPMLDRPGNWDSQRLPNAVALVKALKTTARVRAVSNRFVAPARQAMMK